MAAFAKPLNHLLLEPARNRSPALLALRLAQLLHERAGGRCDAALQRLLSWRQPAVPLPPARRMDEAAIATTVTQLHRRGWDILPWRLDADDIEALHRFAFTTPAYAHDPRDRIPIKPGKIPHDHGRYMWRMADLIRLPPVQRLLSDSTLHLIAQLYLGCRPILTSITLWLDPVYDGTFEAHVYHYDNDGPAFLKYFVYLSDVDLESGAHTYIEGSHGHRKPERFRRARRYDRDELLGYYGADSEIVFAAPAGTILAEDTAGFHKGTTLKKGFRLLLQLQYALLDIPHIEEFTLPRERQTIAELDRGIARIARKFVTA